MRTSSMLTPAAPAAAKILASSPGRSGMTTGTTAYVVGRRAVLARQPLSARVASVDGPGQDTGVGRGTARERVEGRQHLVEVVAQGMQDGRDVPGVARQHRCPQRGVGGRDAGGVPQALPRQCHCPGRRVDEAGGKEARRDLRGVRHERDRLVVRLGRHDDGNGPAGQDESARPVDVLGTGSRVRREDPGPPGEQVRPGRPRAAALAACKGMPPDECAGLRSLALHVRLGSGLDRSDVGVRAGGAAGLEGAQDSTHGRRRDGEHGDVRPLPQRLDPPGTEVRGAAGGDRIGVLETYVDPRGRSAPCRPRRR
jgi:hypothetical protein